MKNRLYRSDLLGLVLAASAAATGCATDETGEASAELKLMDAPPAGVTSVKIAVKSMQVHVSGKEVTKDADPNDTSIDADNKWRILPVGKTIDLVAAQGENAAQTLGQLGLPDGKITQIRLLLDTSKPENNTMVRDGASCNLDVSKVDTKGIKISHPFKALATKLGGKHQVWVDFLLDKSLKDSGKKGDCMILEPVLKLHKVKTDGKDETL